MSDRLESLGDDESIKSQDLAEDEQVVEHMQDDPELVALLKLMVAGMITNKKIISMLNEVYYRAIDQVRRERSE